MAYSYVFDGQFGYLDYLMSSASMTSQVTGATEWHINADDARRLRLRHLVQVGLSGFVCSIRRRRIASSDHDAALIGLSLSGVDAKVRALPRELWPPNHRLRTAVVFATRGVASSIPRSSSVTSSEADSGLGRPTEPATS